MLVVWYVLWSESGALSPRQHNTNDRQTGSGKSLVLAGTSLLTPLSTPSHHRPPPSPPTNSEYSVLPLFQPSVLESIDTTKDVPFCVCVFFCLFLVCFKSKASTLCVKIYSRSDLFLLLLFLFFVFVTCLSDCIDVVVTLFMNVWS